MGTDRVGPQAETVVVLAGDDDPLEAGGLGDGCPLAAVKGRRIEYILGFRAETPFQAGESVGTEMGEHVHLHLLPLDLLGGRNGPVGLRWSYFAAGSDQGEPRYGNN